MGKLTLIHSSLQSFVQRRRSLLEDLYTTLSAWRLLRKSVQICLGYFDNLLPISFRPKAFENDIRVIAAARSTTLAGSMSGPADLGSDSRYTRYRPTRPSRQGYSYERPSAHVQLHPISRDLEIDIVELR